MAKSNNNQGDMMHLRLNRLELEHAYLAEQNAHLVKELSFARCTINALRNITHQKETNLDAARQELDRAYFRIRMLSMTLARQEQRLREQQAAMETRIPSPSSSSSSAVAAGPVAVLQSSPHYHYGQLQTTLCNQLGPQQQQHGYNEYQEEKQQQQPMDHYGKHGGGQGQQLTPPESPRSVVDDEEERSQEEYMCDTVSHQPPVNVMMLPGNFE